MANERIIDLVAITTQSDTDLYECSLNGTGSRKETRAEMRNNMETVFDNRYIIKSGTQTPNYVIKAIDSVTSGWFYEGQQSQTGNTQGSNAISFGPSAGAINQGTAAFAMGFQAGNANQGQNAIAIGNSSGITGQGIQAISIGTNAANANQGQSGIAIGVNAGTTSQGINAIAIGNTASATNQPANTVAIGFFASNSTFTNTVALGQSATNTANNQAILSPSCYWAPGSLGAGTASSSTFLRGDGTWQPLTVARNYTNLGNQAYPYNFTNSGTTDLNFSCFALLQNSPGNSSTINVYVNGILASQVNSSCNISVAGIQGTQPFSFIVPPGGTLQISLIGEAQVSGPIITYISS